MFAGSVSPKAAKKANAKLKVLRQTRAQASKMAAFEHKEKDETGMKNAEIPAREINHPTNQGGAAANGRRVSAGGGIRKAESQVGSRQIDQPENKRTWPKGGGVSASNPKTGNTRMRGPIAPTGGPYGGGGRNTQ